jgi:RHS repeat-associated protein
MHYHLDHLGSVRLITNQNGIKVSAQDYWPFGQEQTPTNQESATFAFNRVDPMKFTGHERDYHGAYNVDNADYLDYMHARVYNPAVGRFLSSDPLVERDAMSAPHLWNRYSYVGSNPTSFNDPTGLSMSPLVCDSKGNCSMDASPDRSWFERDRAVFSNLFAWMSRKRQVLSREGRERLLAPTTVLRDPDYMTASFSFGPEVSPSLSITADRYGRIYLGAGWSTGGPLPVNGSVMFGRMSRRKASSDKLTQLLRGRGKGFTGGAFFGGGVRWTEGGESATVYGLTTLRWDTAIHHCR